MEKIIYWRALRSCKKGEIVSDGQKKVSLPYCTVQFKLWCKGRKSGFRFYTRMLNGTTDVSDTTWNPIKIFRFIVKERREAKIMRLFQQTRMKDFVPVFNTYEDTERFDHDVKEAYKRFHETYEQVFDRS